MADEQEPTDATRLAGVAEQLYGLPLEEFTATRDARVKELRAQGERGLARDVAALRRPTTAAWAVNQLVRARRDEVEQLLALGAALREAQGAFAGEELRELNRQQHRVIAAIRQQARAVASHAGQRLTEAVGRQVEATLKAGMADPAAADAVRSGLLVSDLESTGFDPVDLGGAVAVGAGVGAPLRGGRTAAGPRRERAAGPRTQEGADTRAQEEADTRAQEEADRRAQEDADRVAEKRRREESLREERRREERERALAQARALVARTTEALADAEDVLATAVAAASDARARREAVAARLAELRAALEAAEADDAAAAAEVEVAEESRARAGRDADAARRSAEEATAALARLDREV